MAEDCWGDIHHGTRANPVGVVVQQLAFSTDITDDGDLPHAVESIVAAMDAWWENVRAWLEIVTGQHRRANDRRAQRARRETRCGP